MRLVVVAFMGRTAVPVIVAVTMIVIVAGAAEQKHAGDIGDQPQRGDRKRRWR
jgi:hypothetical protein